MTQTMYDHKDLKILPDQQALKEMDRRLLFHPSTTTDPKMLTTEQIDTYNREGYLKGFPIFDQAEMAEHREQFDAVLNQVLASGGDSYSIISAHIKYGFVYDLLNHPKIVAYVKDILGENVVGWGALLL